MTHIFPRFRPRNSWWNKSSKAAVTALDRGPLRWTHDIILAAKSMYEAGDLSVDIGSAIQPVIGWAAPTTRRQRELQGHRIISQAALRGWQRPPDYDVWELNKVARHQDRADTAERRHPLLTKAWYIGGETQAQIMRLIPGNIPRDLRQDIVQSVWVMLLEKENEKENLASLVRRSIDELLVYDRNSRQSKFVDVDVSEWRSLL